MQSLAKGDRENLEESFVQQGTQLEELFSRYNAEDVCLSLGVSDLWLPNISSQVKHCLAFGVFTSIAPERFVVEARIDSYVSFADFVQKVYALLPRFPMLEDYVPERDWGEVKMTSQGAYLWLFYGCNIERMPDYVEAFSLCNRARPAALDDMHAALALQHHVIESIDRSIIGSADGITSGHVEVPAEPFWQQCRVALASASSALPTGKEPSSDLVIAQGSFRRPKTWSAFGDAVLTGQALPAILIEVNGTRYPLSLRNAPGVVVDLWASRPAEADNELDAGMSIPIADYLQERFYNRDIVKGPFQLITREKRLPYRFAAVLISESTFHFVVVLQETSISLLPEIERDIYNVVASGHEWGIAPEDGRRAFQFRRRDGRLPGPTEVSVLAVLSRYASTSVRLRLAKTTARVLPLADFITIFDSLKNVAELDRFWTYVDNHQDIVSPMSMGLADLFASFRDSHGLLVEGAITPNLISLDPHWGSNWRYRQLAEYWKDAPPLFPDDNIASWTVEPLRDGIQRLLRTDSPSIAWCTTVGGCVLHFVFPIAEQDVDLHNGPLLELIIHCLADAVAQRKVGLEKLPLFARRRIVTVCLPDDATLATESGDDGPKLHAPLFCDWNVTTDGVSATVSAEVRVNLARTQASFTDAADARFEVECLTEWIRGLGSVLREELDTDTLARLNKTRSRMPRFTLKRMPRMVDVPDFASPQIPKPEQYKLARRDLAVSLKESGAEPGRYELTPAKVIIDSARNAFRQLVHTKIDQHESASLLRFCIEQIDALTAEYRREELRLKQSLTHEVSFDRSQAYADAYNKFVTEARNYRYLLECCLSSSSTGIAPVTARAVTELVASIDWLFVLYNASDVLHNGVDVAGVEIDSSFVPQLFYSPGRDVKEKEFGLEMANVKLGLDIDAHDEVASEEELKRGMKDLDAAFVQDAGFSLTHLTQTLQVLARWPTARAQQDFRFCYESTSVEISKTLQDVINDLTREEADKLVTFVTLEPTQIRRLLGKTDDELDVPVWEHTKRGSRYAIRPLIPLGERILAWGAAAAQSSLHIWSSSIANGYLPANFPWPSATAAVRKIKNSLEQKLETRALEVCSRMTPHVIGEIDFKFRFPKEHFEDVGDFDVLAYWPQSNRWLTLECKYNQPPFCFKGCSQASRAYFRHPTGSRRLLKD